MIRETKDRTPDPDERGIRVRSVTPGYVYRIYTDTGEIYAGWEPTEEAARKSAADRILRIEGN